MTTIARKLPTSHLRWACWLAAVFAGSLAVSAAPAQPAAPTYDQLVAQAEAGDPNTDFTALRNAYATSDGYDAYGAKVDPIFADLWSAVGAKDCAKTIAVSDEVLKLDYTRSVVHFVRGDCFDQAGEYDRSEREYTIGRRLVKSLLDSGDGKSVKTAYVVVTMYEEQFLLAHLNLNQERQSLVVDGGHSFDLIEGTDNSTGAKSSVYFNIDALFAAAARKAEESEQTSEPGPPPEN